MQRIEPIVGIILLFSLHRHLMIFWNLWSLPCWSLESSDHHLTDPKLRICMDQRLGQGWGGGGNPHWGVRHSHSCAIHNVQQTCNQYPDTLHNPSCVNHNVQSANMCTAGAVHLCKAGRYRDTQDISPMLFSTLQYLPTVACLLSRALLLLFNSQYAIKCSAVGPVGTCGGRLCGDRAITTGWEQPGLEHQAHSNCFSLSGPRQGTTTTLFYQDFSLNFEEFSTLIHAARRLWWVTAFLPELHD